MKIFNQTTIAFTKKAEIWLKEILANEVHAQVRRSRFQLGLYTYPIHIVVFQDNQSWGWFDPHTYQIGLNQKLLYTAKDQVIKDILRHELAHYLCFIQGHNDATPHGAGFQAVCEKYRWGDLIKKASLNLDHQELQYSFERKDKLLNKVKSLLKLASSDNPHEAELATLKANQLLLKHNLNVTQDDDWTLYSKTVLEGKKRSAKMSAIYSILKHFLVAPVFIYGQKCVKLEVSGGRENIELADYVAEFLAREMEKLWQEQTELKGARAKNAFFLGLAKGYDQKMTHQTFTPTESKQLIVLKNQLQDRLKLAHRRLSSTTHSNSSDQNAFSKGRSKGQNLNINKAMKNNQNKIYLLGGPRE